MWMRDLEKVRGGWGREEKEVPDEEGPGSRGDVGLLAVVVDGGGRCHGVDIGAEEDEVDDDVDDFEQDAIFPRVGHGGTGCRHLPAGVLMYRHEVTYAHVTTP